MKNISILGATGSIGDNTCDVVAQHPDKFNVVAMTAWNNADKAIALAHKFTPQYLAVSPLIYDTVKNALSGTNTDVVSGADGLNTVASIPADVIVAGIVGQAGLLPTLTAVQQGTTVALANKETLVSAGTIVMNAVAQSGCTLLPVDSEHNAIFQCLDSPDLVEKLILTASGGALRTTPTAELATITPAQAIRHPNWDMGAKISIDTATMMNKGLELIEACHLFSLPPEKIDVVVHPESIIHSMVQYVDGSIIGQMGHPDMRVPIAYALCYPDRIPVNTPPLDFATLGQMTFDNPRYDAFPALTIARECQTMGQGATNVLNASNEVAVQAFLDERIGFTQIIAVIMDVLERADLTPQTTMDGTLEQDTLARTMAGDVVAQLQG